MKLTLLSMKNITLTLIISLFALFSLAGESIVLDVRTPSEYQESHVKGSTNVDFKNSSFKSEIEKLDKSKSYKLYCRSGNRSGQTLKIMKELGFKDVENLGSLSEAVRKLNGTCEGPKSC